VLGIGYMALFASVLACIFWSVGVSRLGPARSGQFINLMPVFGASLAFLVLGEVPGSAEIVGAVLVLVGIATVESGRARG
jgi:drug/metabolite transporter (DMT)-like permease